MGEYTAETKEEATEMMIRDEYTQMHLSNIVVEGARNTVLTAHQTIEKK